MTDVNSRAAPTAPPAGKSIDREAAKLSNQKAVEAEPITSTAYSIGHGTIAQTVEAMAGNVKDKLQHGADKYQSTVLQKGADIAQSFEKGEIAQTVRKNADEVVWKETDQPTTERSESLRKKTDSKTLTADWIPNIKVTNPSVKWSADRIKSYEETIPEPSGFNLQPDDMAPPLDVGYVDTAVTSTSTSTGSGAVSTVSSAASQRPSEMKPLGVRDPNYNPRQVREQNVDSTGPVDSQKVGVIANIADSFAHGKIANAVTDMADAIAHGGVAQAVEKVAGTIAEKGKDDSSMVPASVGKAAESFEKGSIAHNVREKAESVAYGDTAERATQVAETVRDKTSNQQVLKGKSLLSDRTLGMSSNERNEEKPMSTKYDESLDWAWAKSTKQPISKQMSTFSPVAAAIATGHAVDFPTELDAMDLSEELPHEAMTTHGSMDNSAITLAIEQNASSSYSFGGSGSGSGGGLLTRLRNMFSPSKPNRSMTSSSSSSPPSSPSSSLATGLPFDRPSSSFPRDLNSSSTSLNRIDTETSAEAERRKLEFEELAGAQ